MGWYTFAQFVEQKAKEEAEKTGERDTRGAKKRAAKRSTEPRLPYDPFLAAKGCEGCPLNEADLRHPKMPPTGARKPAVYILGEAPGEDEDNEGKQFVGKSGQVLRKALPRGYEDITRFNNTIRCRPPKNREPSPLELACCRKQNEKDIEQAKPKVIIGTGAVPLEWMIGETAISGWRGRKIPAQIGSHKFWYVPVLHPSYVMRTEHSPKGSENTKIFKRDLEFAYSLEDRPAPIDVKEADDGIVLLPCDIKKVRKAIEEVVTWGDYAVDIETNGLRPFFPEAKILTCAVSNYETTYAIPVAHREVTWTDSEKEELIGELLPYMLKAKGKRIAHSSKFEQEWFVKFCGESIVHEVEWHDTMAQAYTLDERGSGTKSLGSLTRIYFGFDVKALSNIDTSRLDEYPLRDVLAYNSYDPKYTQALFWVQAEELEREGLVATYEMHNERAGPIVLATSRGVLPNKAVAERYDRELTEKIKEIKARICEHEAVIRFNKTSLSEDRKKKNKTFSPTSNPDVQVLIKSIVPREAKDLITSVNEEVLEQIDHPIADWILELRGLLKQHGTYIVPNMPPDGKNIWPDGLIHTEFNHLKLVTGRLSSDSPNLQNLPSRKGKEIRDIIMAPKGHVIVSADYGQIEARVIGMASKDKFLCKALWEKYDIHTEWAQKIATAYPRVIGGKQFLTDKQAMKDFRSRIKNEWTFPLFYGSVLPSVSNSLEIPETTLKPLYDEFWDTFDGVHDWQQDLVKFYRANHYVESLTGRRRHAPMGFNEVINTPIQGSASDIVVDAMVRLSRRAWNDGKPQYQFRINVHDDLTFYIPEKTLEEDMEVITRDMVLCPFDFITVPLTVEVKVGRTWGNMEDVAVISSTDFQ